jgi:sugar lactone lactonase YvrE
MTRPLAVLQATRSRVGIVTFLASGLLLGSVFAYGNDRPVTRAEFSSGSAWLPSYGPGQLTLLDGATGQVVDQLAPNNLPEVEAGDQLQVAQSDRSAYVADGRSGVVDLVDDASDRVTVSRAAVPSRTAEVELYAGGQHLYILDAKTGDVTVVDPNSLRTESPPQPLSARPAATALDDNGDLWVEDARTGRVDELDGPHTRVRATVVDPYGADQLTVIEGKPALLDLAGMSPEVRLIESLPGARNQPACLGAAAGQMFGVTGNAGAPRLWLASDESASVRQTDLATSRCTVTTKLENVAAQFGTPLDTGGKLYLADQDTGRVTVINDVTGAPVAAPVEVTTPHSVLDLLVKDGIVFYNDPLTPDAGVIRPDGSVVRAVKYDQRHWAGTPAALEPTVVSQHSGEPASGTPLAGLSTLQPSASQAGGPAVSLSSSPASGGPGPTPAPGGSARLEVTSTGVAAATVGRPYQAQLTASGGQPPYAWSVGGLPAGLSVSAASGLITGTPLVAGNLILRVSLSDRLGHQAGANVPLHVYPQPALPPTVSGVTPDAGPSTGGTTVAIQGLHLAAATAVSFGKVAATGLNVISETEVSVTAPSGAVGAIVDVTVTTSAGTSAISPSDTYAYTNPLMPTITGLSEVEGLASGGAEVEVTGTHLANVTQVDFGTVEATSFTANSDTSLTVTTPPAQPGPVDVTVTSPDGTSPASPADRYIYVTGLTTTAWLATSFAPNQVAMDASGNMFVSLPRGSGDAVYMKSPNGPFVLYAGNGNPGYSGDGHQAAQAELNDPVGIALDRSGNLYIADFFNHRIRRVDRQTGIITTVAGDGSPVVGGMGGPAISAGINSPYGLAFAPDGDLFCSASTSNLVYRIAAFNGGVTGSSDISIYAGGGPGFGSVDGDGGPATKAHLATPAGLTMNAQGNLYIADELDGRIRKVTPPSAGQIITTVAGGSKSALSVSPSPQNALAVSLIDPSAIAFDPFGDLYIAESDDRRVDLLAPSGTIFSVVGGEPDRRSTEIRLRRRSSER